MKHKQLISFAIGIVIVGLLVDVFFGRFIAAKIATLPLVKRWHLLSPQTPLVINTREVIKSDNADTLETAAEQTKNKLVTVLRQEKATLVPVGTAVNISEDGVFLSVKGVFVQTGVAYSIRMPAGNVLPIDSAVSDPASGLVFFKVQASNVSVASFGTSADLSVGKPLAVETTGSTAFSIRTAPAVLSRAQSDLTPGTYDASLPAVNFEVSGTTLTLSSVVTGLNGDVFGIYDGRVIIPSDIIRSAIDNFFKNKQVFKRANLGFTYAMILPIDFSATVPEGARIISIADGSDSPARAAGLAVGDVITQVDGKAIKTSFDLATALIGAEPGKAISLQVVHNGASGAKTLTPTELK